MPKESTENYESFPHGAVLLLIKFKTVSKDLSSLKCCYITCNDNPLHSRPWPVSLFRVARHPERISLPRKQTSKLPVKGTFHIMHGPICGILLLVKDDVAPDDAVSVGFRDRAP